MSYANMSAEALFLEASRLRVALVKLTGSVLTVKITNQPEWIDRIVGLCNEACEALGDPDRFRFNGFDVEKLTPDDPTEGEAD